MNRVVTETSLSTGRTLQLVQGEITLETSEAIVNAANSYLQHGAGIAGSISREGGPQIQAESDAWVQAHGPVSHESPAWTTGGRLPCRYVIHAVGPVWEGDSESSPANDADRKLEACIHSSLELADQLSVRSISIPAISTGIFGFPKARAAGILLNTIRNYFANQPTSCLGVIRIVLYDPPTLAAFERGWHDLFNT